MVFCFTNSWPIGALCSRSGGQLSSSQVDMFLSTNGSLFYKQLTNGSPLLTFWRSTFLFSVRHVRYLHVDQWQLVLQTSDQWKPFAHFMEVDLPILKWAWPFSTNRSLFDNLQANDSPSLTFSRSVPSTLLVPLLPNTFDQMVFFSPTADQ